jgi:hypothetical protein
MWIDHFLEALYRTGSRQLVGCDECDWWSRRASCYSTGDEHMVKDRR